MKKTFFAIAILLSAGALSSAQTIDLTSQASPKVAMTAQKSSITMPDGKVVPMWDYVCTASGLIPDPCITQPSGWAPGPTIIVKPGPLEIDLTNSLPTPTSITILGQLGGGLGSPVKVASPNHPGQTLTTWPASTPGNFTPPAQADRVRTFGTETGPNSLGTYTWLGLKPGTYLYETGTHPSIQAPMGLYGVIVVTNEPTANPFAVGNAYPGSFPNGGASLAGVPYDADQAMLLSEVDAAQNIATDAANGDESKYPHAVDYKPTYFLLNGKAFDRSAPTLLPVGPSVASQNVLLRFVNAGLRTHIPATVGLSMSLVAEDGHVLPGVPKVQTEILLTAGKTIDAIVHPPVTSISGTAAYSQNVFPIFDRQLSLSTGNRADGGIQGYLQVAGGLPANSGLAGAVTPTVVNDFFNLPLNATSFSGNVLKNDIAVSTAQVTGSGPAHGSVTLNADGTFTYTPSSTPAVNDSFTYFGNGNQAMVATVTLSVTAAGALPKVSNSIFTSPVQSVLKVPAPGVLANASDPANYQLTASPQAYAAGTPFTVKDTNGNTATITLNADGSILASSNAAGATSYTFLYTVTNAQGQKPLLPATVTLVFPVGNGPHVSLLDAQTGAALDGDYKWTIEQDTTWPVDTSQASMAVANGATPPQSLGTNFHKSYMPLIATGCTGPKSCGDGQMVMGQPVPAQPVSTPDQVLLPLDPTPGSTNNRFYVSILPGDAGDGGHTMAGGSFTGAGASVTLKAEPQPLQTAQLSVFIFEDNNPTNGDEDEGEPGLGGFQIRLFDVRASTGDPAGQMTYDAFNQPLSNSLLGQPDCPGSVPPGTPTGVIITCPDGSPLAGMALIKNLMPMRYDVVANPGAAREGKGEQWLQVSTLEGTFAQDAFAKVGEPTYFQEFGSPGFHSFIGFVNPKHVNDLNKTLGGTNTVTGTVTNLHMDRPPKINLWDSGKRDALNFTTCYVGLNSNGGTAANVAFAQCDPQTGAFTLNNVPAGNYSLVVWDQWLDQIIAYKQVIVPAGATQQTVAMGDVAVFSWFTNLNQSAFLDLNQNGRRDADDPGIQKIPMTVRFRDGSISNLLGTDENGMAPFEQLFPLFNWYVAESDTTRFKGTQVAVSVDAGGPDSCTANTAQNTGTGTALPAFCNNSNPYKAAYDGLLSPQPNTGDPNGTHPRFDPGTVQYEGVQGFISQVQAIDWGKTPYVPNENGGIQGMVIYASTRGFDDPRLEVQFTWEPAVPNVPVNLYQEVTNPDGTTSLRLVDSTTTNSWDATAPNMHCPGQDPNDPFVKYTIGTAQTDKCYDGFHNFNQIQPAVYDGRYRFPTSACATCVANPAYVPPSGTTPGKYAPKVLPPGKYVVEVVPAAGYEIIKEEDKNILIGDQWIAPATQQFGGLGNIYILPDQATIDETLLTTAKNSMPACVGSSHIVPDYLALFPGVHQTAPFAGQSRNLCNRKEVVLEDQTQANADFHVFTPAPVAGHFTGMMLNDAAAEFNQISPSFGEKEALPNVPVSIKDFNGIEILRVYTDKWGQFNGLAPSTWEANVPNPSGYSPNMLITCMNDPGPIVDSTGQLVTDPQYNPMYSNFCYTWPFMPGITTYLDTPVLPVAAFASKYNPVDCAYPAGTPAIKRVDGNGGKFGPYLDKSKSSMQLTITSLGQAQVPNPDYTGPQNFTASPSASLKLITRDFGFGSVKPTVTLGGVAIPAGNVTWSASSPSITVTVPSTFTTGSFELGITRNDNQAKSVDTVTVTIEDSTAKGYRAPTFVEPATTAGATGLLTPIQDAIDAAAPGDLIMLDAGSYPELVIMWKPVRLQGVGAPAVTINATKYPTQKLESWRQRINTLFGIDAQGNQTLPALVDPLPGQEITGGVVQLEPSVLSTEEGAGITVLGKQDVAGGGGFGGGGRSVTYGPNSYANHASRIDGLTVTGGDSGGGIYVNGWATNLEISNNRVHGNAGTYNGGVRIGQPYLEGLAGGGPFNYDANVKIHHNAVTTNGTVEANAAPGSSAASTAGAGGGISICTGTDNYTVNYNFICGNFSAGDGGGLAHFGLSRNGIIANNKILFNQSYNQTSATNGGGLAIEGEPPTGATLTLGTGEVTVDSNLIQGNFSQGGSGGGIRLQFVNGTEVGRNNKGYQVMLTNNMVANNVAGAAGGGISLADAINTAIINNTVASNDGTGIAGAVIGSNGAGPMTGVPSPAGIAIDVTSPALLAAAGVVDPGPAPVKGANESAQAFARRLARWQAAENAYLAQLASISLPVSLLNNIVWQNRSFYFDGSSGAAQLCNSNNVTDATQKRTCNVLASNPTYACNSSAKFWDAGFVGDTSPTSANPLPFTHSVLTNSALYPGNTNTSSNPGLVSQYCNGPITQFGQYWEPQQPFLPSPNMSVSATLDEAGNFVSLSYGPLSQNNSVTGALYGDYHISASTSATKGFSGSSSVGYPPNHDYDNQARPIGGIYNIGADQYAGSGLVVTPASLVFAAQVVGSTSNAQSVSVTNNGAAYSFAGKPVTVSTPFSILNTSTCTGPLATNASCVINVAFTPNAAGAVTGTLTIVPAVTGNAPVPAVTASLSGSGTSGVTISPGTIDFGAVSLNTTSSAIIVTLANNTNAQTPINIGSFAAPFAGTTTCRNNLAAAASCTISITFAPGNSTAQQSASITISDGNGQAAHRQTLSLTGHGQTPQLYVTPVSLSFGSVPVNNTSVTQAVTVTNTGTTAFTLNSVTSPAGFAVASSSCTPNLVMNGGDTCVLNIAFKPTANSPQTGTLSINTTAGARGVTLAGTRVNGAISASPNQVAFGAVLFGSTSASQSVTLTNTGNTAVNQLTLGNLNNGFAHSACLNAQNAAVTSLGAGASCVVNLTFAPTNNNPSTRTATLNVNNNPLVALSGNGTSVALTPASIVFPGQAVFSASAPQTVTIANGTGAAIALNGLTFGGANPDAFTRSNGGTCNRTVPARGSCSIQVAFTPTATDQQTATLSLSGQSVALSGTGKYLLVSPGLLSFAAKVGAVTPTQVVTVTNSGNTAATTIAVTSSNPAFAITTNCLNLTAKASCTVAVTYTTPSAPGTDAGTLLITSDQAATPENVALSAITQ